MAILSKKGIIKGSAGNLVFRYTAGKNIMSSRPGRSLKPASPAQSFQRERIRFCSGLSSAMNKIPQVKTLWEEKSARKCEAYNSIMRSVFNKTSEVDSISVVPLSPFKGDRLIDIYDFQLLNDKIGFTIIHFNPGNLPSKFSFAAVILAEEPLNMKDKPYKFVPVYSGDFQLNGSVTEVEEILDKYQSPVLSAYNRKSIILMVFYKDRKNNPAGISDTFYFE